MPKRLAIQYTDTLQRAVARRADLGLGELAAESAVVTRLAEVGARALEQERQLREREAFYGRLSSDDTYQAEVRAQAQAAIEDRNF